MYLTTAEDRALPESTHKIIAAPCDQAADTPIARDRTNYNSSSQIALKKIIALQAFRTAVPFLEMDQSNSE